MQKSSSNRPPGRQLGVLRHLLVYLRPYQWRIGAALLALLVAAGAILAIGQMLRYLVDAAFMQGNPALLDRMFLVLAGVTTLLAVAVYWRSYLVAWLGERVTADIRRQVFEHLLTLSPGFYEITRPGEVQSRLTADTTLLQQTVGLFAVIALRNLLLVIGGLIMLAFTSFKLTLLLMLVVPLVLLPIIVYGRQVRRLSRLSQDRVAEVGAYVDEVVHGIRTVQACNHEAIDRRRYGERVEQAFHTARLRIQARSLLAAVATLVIFLAIGVVLWAGGHDVLAGRISEGELAAFLFYSVLVAGSVGALSEVIGNLQRAAGAMERLLELLATRAEITAPRQPLPLPYPPRGEVAFEAVSFHYPARPDSVALDRFSLKVQPGERLALVGPSGAGKSTVFQLLLRFYDPQQGVIRFDGVDLRRTDPYELRRRIGLVPQEPVIFAADAWENIRYGRPEASDKEVRAAAEAAHAVEFLDELPDGFATFLGEGGVRLSGGQRQRLAIARAILRDPALLLLDEATSALDAESERLVQVALQRLMSNRTTLIIAHRLATVRGVDRIAVMHRGCLIACGRHEQLIRQGGLYAHLAALQFAESEASLGSCSL